MTSDDPEWPEWIVQQRGKPRRSPGYVNRHALIRRWVNELKASDQAVSHERIREMLRFVDRGYSLKSDQISRSLSGFFKSGAVRKMPNGQPVRIDGKKFPSARAAADTLEISPQSVLNRIASKGQKWAGWKRTS